VGNVVRAISALVTGTFEGLATGRGYWRHPSPVSGKPAAGIAETRPRYPWHPAGVSHGGPGPTQADFRLARHVLVTARTVVLTRQHPWQGDNRGQYAGSGGQHSGKAVTRSDGSDAVNGTSSGHIAGSTSGGRRSALSPAGRAAARLGGFLLLLVLVFGAAHAAGARLGPVAPGSARTGESPATTPNAPMSPMDMGAPPADGGVP
jgi:hypothetical protein